MENEVDHKLAFLDVLVHNNPLYLQTPVFHKKTFWSGFAIRTISIKTVQVVHSFKSWQIQHLQLNMCKENVFILSFFAKKLHNRLIFYRAYNMDEENEYSPSIFLWMLFSATWKIIGWQMKELKAYLLPSLTNFPSNFFTQQKKKGSSQQQFSVFSTTYSDTWKEISIQHTHRQWVKKNRDSRVLAAKCRSLVHKYGKGNKPQGAQAIGGTTKMLSLKQENSATPGQYSLVRPSCLVSKRLYLGVSAEMLVQTRKSALFFNLSHLWKFPVHSQA